MTDTSTANAAQGLETARDLNAFVREPFRLAGADQGPLAGTDVVVKANIAVKGRPFCGATPALETVTAEESAGTVERLLAAGATIVAQTNLHELAFGITSANAHHGAVRNPYASDRMAGGSSGGTAAAIGAGAVTMGLGSDTGGSGRLPAAMCGCVGLRPTIGRYPADGVLTLSTTLDTVSSMGKTAADVARLDAVLAGEPDTLPAVVLNGLRLGIARDPFWSGISSAMDRACGEKLAELEAAGAVPVEIVLPGLIELTGENALPLVISESRTFWEPFVRDRLGMTLSDFAETIASPDVRGIYQAIASDEAPGPEIAAGIRETAIPEIRSRIRDAMDENRLDALVFPTLAEVAPPVDQTETLDLDGEVVPLFDAMTRRELPVSMAGIPSLSVPAGLNPEGLPYGLELVGRAGEDRKLIAIAAAIEERLGRLPGLGGAA
ncbi:MAG: amidase family protein [Pseudomonadota bacterium]